MKLWIVSALLSITFALQTTVKDPEAENAMEDLSQDAGELSVEELVAAAEDENQDSGSVYAAEDRAVFCPSGWFRHGSRCFLLVRSATSWLSAERYCVSNQASLASIQSPDEHNVLQSLLTIAGVSTAWIGAYNFQNTWLWIDRAGFYYTNWQSLSSVSSYPCAIMRSTSGWANTNCGSGYPYFCSMTPVSC